MANSVERESGTMKDFIEREEERDEFDMNSYMHCTRNSTRSSTRTINCTTYILLIVVTSYFLFIYMFVPLYIWIKELIRHFPILSDALIYKYLIASSFIIKIIITTTNNNNNAFWLHKFYRFKSLTFNLKLEFSHYFFCGSRCRNHRLLLI